MESSNFIKELFSNRRNVVKILIDVILIFLSTIIAIVVRFENNYKEHMNLSYFFVYVIVFFIFYIWNKLGVKSWRYTNSSDVLKLILANIFSFIALLSYYSLAKESFSRSVVFLIFSLSIIAQLGSRLLFILRRTYSIHCSSMKDRKKTIIYGAGEAGVNLSRESIQNNNFPYDIVAFVDDDKKKIGTYINDIKVFPYSTLNKKLKDLNIETLIIAMPYLNKEKLNELIEKIKFAENRGISIKILPTFENILSETSLVSQIKDIQIEDLLGRAQVLVNGDNIRKLIDNKVIFITGGSGSIGSELARQIAKYLPKKLVLIDLNENSLYFLQLELERTFKNLNLEIEIANIRERDKVDFLFEKYKPKIVFHAAAHKHVPLMEHNPEEAIKNNIFGTRNVMLMADKHNVESFVLISTDKAVNPTNVMGATKRGCELVLEHINKTSKTKFMAVRFGNVLGSSGSVIPHFKQLIKEGKNLTLTHEEITRYFMTISEAAQLVMEAGSLGNGGEIFILDMGKPVKIIDLANNMIKLSGAKIGIDVIGLRQGEKLFEELLYDTNVAIKTENKKIFITKIEDGEINVEEQLKQLKKAIILPNKKELKQVLKNFIVSYKEPSHNKD
ncbi:MAG: polysaccharide biosynthesis protein [Fusobacteriaceae bacterium]